MYRLLRWCFGKKWVGLGILEMDDKNRDNYAIKGGSFLEILILFGAHLWFSKRVHLIREAEVSLSRMRCKRAAVISLMPGKVVLKHRKDAVEIPWQGKEPVFERRKSVRYKVLLKDPYPDNEYADLDNIASIFSKEDSTCLKPAEVYLEDSMFGLGQLDSFLLASISSPRSTPDGPLSITRPALSSSVLSPPSSLERFVGVSPHPNGGCGDTRVCV
jgi:hypothetical protein